MANRMNEDEKHEKIIRGLLKLPANKRCINCNSLGPQYVCTNFWTFVCTTCSGIHREFTHRIKSVSMAKFSQEEVSALQRGGNECAREVYFKEWNPQHHFAPDSSNVERLRTFIKHIYVDKRYNGEKSIDRRQKGNKESTTEFRRADTFHSTQSLSFEDTYEHCQIKQSSPGGRNYERDFRYGYSGRSPGYDQGSQRHNTFKKSPRHFEVVDDRFQDDNKDRNGSKNRRSEDRWFSDRISKAEGMSLKYQKDVDVSVPSIVRPVKDILGKKILPLQVGESPKADGDRSNDGSVTQRTSSSSGLKSTNANLLESKKVDTGSLINFDADPEPPARAAQSDPFTGESARQQTMNTSADNSIWSSLSYGYQEKAPHSPNASTSASALSQLSAQATAPVDKISKVSVDVVDAALRAGDRGQCFTTQQNWPLLFASADASQSTVPQGIPQPWSSSLAPNAQGPLTARLNLPKQNTPNPAQEAIAMAPSQAPPTEAKPVGRKELPADLFTVSNSPAPAPFSGWCSAPSNAMGFSMPYSTTMAMPNFTQPSKSTNPFDLTSESTVADSPRFPSMSPLQGSLPNMAVHPALVHTSSFGTPTPPLLRTSSLGTPSLRMVPPHLPSYHTSAVFPSVYMMQHASGNILRFRHQGIEGSSSEENPFGINAMDMQPKAPSNPQQASPNSFSSLGGNPFS